MKLTKNLYWYPESGFFTCNSYLVDDDVRVLIDPGLKRYLKNLLNGMREDGFKAGDVGLIVNTHSHPDHSGANQSLKDISHAKIAIHKLEEDYMRSMSQGLLRAFAGMVGAAHFEADFHLADEFSTGNTRFEVLLTPGHSPGSISLHCEELKLLVCGDVVFKGSIGRVDLPGGGAQALKNSIELLSKLDIEYLLPGHMGIIKGREPVRKNFELVKRIFLEG